MKLERSKEWWAALARSEPDGIICAGVPLDRPEDVHFFRPQETATGKGRIAFGKFMALMRRRHGFSTAQLAEKVGIDPREVIIIEEDVHHIPHRSAVSKLAQFFNVPEMELMELAGLAGEDDSILRQELMRFCDRCRAPQELSSEEDESLNRLLAVLSEKATRSL